MTYDFQLTLFYEIIGNILKGSPLPSSSETWSRKLITRKDFNKLRSIDPAMSKEEIERRIRATSFGEFQPAIEISGFIFELKAINNGKQNDLIAK